MRRSFSSLKKWIRFQRTSKKIIYFIFINFLGLELVGVYLNGNKDRPIENSGHLLMREAPTDLYFFKRTEYLADKIKAFRHWGLISQLDKDMGDTLQRTGSYYVLMKYLGVNKDDLGRSLYSGYHHDMNQLSDSEGFYRRSNNPFFWGYDPFNCSRDQIFAAQAAIIYYKDFNRGRKLFRNFVSRAFLNQNTRDNGAYPWQKDYAWKIPDIPTPSQLSLLLRGLGTGLVYPFVFVLDAFIIADVMYFRKIDSRQLWDFDIKQIPALIAANSYLPTPWSKWGLEIYLQNKTDIVNRVFYYNQDQYNGIWPLAHLYKLTLEKMLSQQNSMQALNKNTQSLD